MRTALLVLALGGASAISAPRTKTALQLRGGGLDDLDVVQVGAAALGAAGLNQWISPKASFEIYGVTKTDASALALRRGVGAWQATRFVFNAAQQENLAEGIPADDFDAETVTNQAVLQLFSAPRKGLFALLNEVRVRVRVRVS